MPYVVFQAEARHADDVVESRRERVAQRAARGDRDRLIDEAGADVSKRLETFFQKPSL